jgi:hypothetical protein
MACGTRETITALVYTLVVYFVFKGKVDPKPNITDARFAQGQDMNRPPDVDPVTAHSSDCDVVRVTLPKDLS